MRFNVRDRVTGTVSTHDCPTTKEGRAQFIAGLKQVTTVGRRWK